MCGLFDLLCDIKNFWTKYPFRKIHGYPHCRGHPGTKVFRNLWCSLQAYHVHEEHFPSHHLPQLGQVQLSSLGAHQYHPLPWREGILDAARASTKRSQPADIWLGNSLFFTDFKFFSTVTALHIPNNPTSMEHKALWAHIECGIYDWTNGDFYGSPSEEGAVKYATIGDARLFQYCMGLDKKVASPNPYSFRE